MRNEDLALLQELERVANEKYDGHVTIMKFTTNWRVWFGTPGDRGDIQAAPNGQTFRVAAERALATAPSHFGGGFRCHSCGEVLHNDNRIWCPSCDFKITGNPPIGYGWEEFQ